MQNDPYSIGCIDYGDTPNPLAFERIDYLNGYRYPKLAELDLTGGKVWYNVYRSYNGQFRKIIQVNDGYIAIGQAIFKCATDIAPDYSYVDNLNVAQTDLLDDIDEEVDKKYKLLYIIKTDDEGIIENARMYGIVPSDNAEDFETAGYNIFEDADGNFVFCGFANIVDPEDEENTIVVAFAGKIDENLDLIWNHTYLTDESLYSYTESMIEFGENYYLAASKVTNSPSGPASPPENSIIHILKLDESTGDIVEDGDFVIDSGVDPDIANILEYPYDVSCDGCPNANYEDFNDCTAHGMIVNNGDLLVAATINRSSWYQDTGVRGIGKVYRLTSDCFTSDPDDCAQVINVGEFQTFDLRMGITNTFDDGYAIVSSLHIEDLYEPATARSSTHHITYFPPSTSADFPFDNPGEKEGNTRYWNSDAYVAKYDDSDNLIWSATYPKTDNIGTYFPHDIKMEECFYHIVESPDHGFVIGGNSSSNFDDDLAIKIYNECSINATYEGTNDIDENTNISTNTTWSSSRKVKGIITITTGHSLTISGSSTVIQFADSKASNIPTYIVVERGAKLQIEGGAILTGNAECGTMWEGIYVYGTNGTNQPSASSIESHSYFDVGGNFGVVRLITGGTIQNARCGIFAGKKTGNIIVSSYGGGIVITDGADFINNSVDVTFAPYTKSNKSLLRLTDFATDDILLDEAENPTSHVLVINNKHVDIRGCTFENTTSTEDYSDTERGKGIYSISSFITVDDDPDGFNSTGTGSNPNTFADLTYGVYAVAPETGSDNIEVNRNIFDNNFRGYYLSGAVLSETDQNSFNIKIANDAYGMYLDNCTAYGVDENLFEQDNTSIIKTAGIIINNSGTDDNLIYRNSFQNVKLGSIAMDDNGSIDPVSGLVFKCGDYATSWVDIGVLDGNNPGTINPNQGECLDALTLGYLKAPANNLFTDPTNVISDGQFFTDNDVNDILYVFFEDDDESTTPFAKPKEFSSTVDPFPAGTINDDGCTTVPFDIEDWATDYCPTHFTSGGGERLANESFTKSLINSKKNNSSASFREEGDSIEKIENVWEQNIMLHAQLRYFMSEGMQDSILILLDGNESPLANAILSAIAADNNDFESAEIYNAELENNEAIMQGYSFELQEIALKLIRDTLSWLDLDSAQLATVRTLAEENNHTGIKAQHIICYLSGKQYHEIIPIIDAEQEEIAKTVQEKHNTNPNSIYIYPNPIGNYAIIQINFSGSVVDKKFIISDITGTIIQEYDLKNGINFIEISNQILHPGAYIGYVNGMVNNELKKQFIVIQ